MAEVFERRGYSLARDIELRFEGVAFTADGWDAAAKVGFEYLTHAAGDHLDLTADEMAVLGAMIERGELFMLLIDEHEVDSVQDLEWAAERFLDAVAERRDAAPNEGT
ncbi:hypothetical protein DB30_06112 [Enhygromyxa salina]|uniref:Uncharacterized protein n=1 Tax=Enhygromyxa salina TaxID=215803 RepID=A0A0C2CZN3_9BACT|nr:hypothetical protein DB30_06112 [Enhygromyxa salina]